MNWFELLALSGQISVALKVAERQGAVVRGGDSALYIACRQIAENLEARNPGIAEQSGYVTKLSDLAPSFRVNGGAQ